MYMYSAYTTELCSSLYTIALPNVYLQSNQQLLDDTLDFLTEEDKRVLPMIKSGCTTAGNS